MLEREISKQVDQALKSWRLTKVVEWYMRIQSGKVRLGAHFMKLADKGTPDYLALIRTKENNLAAVFIEVKSPTGQLGPNQIQFAKDHIKKDIYVLEIRDVKDLNGFINDIGIDYIKDIEI